MNKQLSDLAIGRFERLAPYLSHLTLDDLDTSVITTDNLFHAVPPEHKLIMKIFTRQVIDPRIRPNVTLTSTQPMAIRDGCLNLSDQLTSTRFASDQYFTSYRILVDKICDIAQKCFPVVENVDKGDGLDEQDKVDERNNCTAVVARRNHLFEEDLIHIVSLVLMFPQCELVDLSGNRFQGPTANASIKQLLDLPNIRYLVIIENEVGSVFRKEFLANLSHDHLRKLVWIPEPWINVGKWKDLLDKSLHPLVKATHQAYFS